MREVKPTLFKTPFSTYIEISTATKLEEYLNATGKSKTEVANTALVKYLTEVEGENKKD